MREEGAKGADLALDQLGNINEYISAVQIGVTMTSIGIGALGEPALANLLKGALGDTLSHGVAVAVSAVVAFMIIASAQLIAGEMVPKFYAIDRAEAVARRVARPLQAFSVLFRPFIVALTAVADRILRLLGVDMSLERRGGSPDELKRLIAESHAGGHIDLGEAGMLTGVFHLHEQEARQVMTPIPAVVTIDVSQDVQQALQLCVSSGHTRLLVTEEEDRDRVRGIVHASTLIGQLMQDGPHAPVLPLVHDAPIVPETKPLDDLLAELQRQRTSMAVVVDEYGRVAGIVTVEDIIEEIVGEIADETDPAAGEIRKLADGDWFVRGHVAVTDLADYGLRPAGRQRRLQLRRRLRVCGARTAAPARGHGLGERLLDQGRVGPRQSHRGGAHSRAPPRAPGRGPRVRRRVSAPARRTADPKNTSGPRGERAGSCALGGGGCAFATVASHGQVSPPG